MLQKLKKLIPEDFFLRVWWHQLESWCGAAWYGFPSRKLRVIAVTGTDGKTTTTHMIAAILRAAQQRVGMTSTTDFRIGDEQWENQTHQTTLGRFFLQSLLHRMVRVDCDYAVIEASSHALHQGRLNGVTIDVAAITNITHEHLDYHKTFANYLAAKLLLFEKLAHTPIKKGVSKAAVVNLDMAHWDKFARAAGTELIGYTTDPSKRTTVREVVWASEITSTATSTSFTAHVGTAALDIALPMTGTYNVSNALAAIAVCHAQGIALEVMKHALSSLTPVPGRLEPIQEGQAFNVYVDFAVTPGALEHVYRSLRHTTPGRIIAVFGATGNRDPEKRPMMGKIATELADLVYLTDDEPYTEDPVSIRKHVIMGVSSEHRSKLHEIPDRREAIIAALREARAGDSVVITGMGNFQYRVIGNVNVPWDERVIVRTLLAELNTPNA